MTAQNKKPLIPQLRFAEFDGEWELKKLGDITTLFSGGTPTSTNKQFYQGEIPFIGSGNIRDYEVSNFITKKAFESSSAKMVEVGDLLYALYGANSGDLAISKMSGAINQAILCIRTKKENLYFLYSLLLSNKEQIVCKYLQGGQGNLSAKIIKNLKYGFPRLPEQQKIASFLTAVDKKLQQLTTKKEQLEHYKKGVMQQLFSQQLRFKDGDGNDFPDWEEKRLGEICEITMGQSPDSKSYNENGKGVLLIQGNADIKNRKAEPRQWTTEPTKMCTSGDLIMTVRAPVGYIAKTLHEACIGRGVCRINNNSKSIQEFLFQFLLNFEAKWIRLEQGSTFTAVSGNDIKTLKIGIPCKKEQQKIAAYLSALDAKIETVAGQLVKTQKFKKGLLQRLFV